MMDKTRIQNVVPSDLVDNVADVDQLVEEFASVCQPLEPELHVLVDARTNARYLECHVHASKLIELATIDVPLDPNEQPEYRANREIVVYHHAFDVMKEDAQKRRGFSNIVVEYTRSFNPRFPLKIIGGQHRYEAIKLALINNVDEYHGLKVYFGLDSDQRLDVQLISNTVIAVSTDLYDRMQETVRGPQLRSWCQEVGLLEPGQDFADKRARGEQITVKIARAFIVNYFKGKSESDSNFEQTETTPYLPKSGEDDIEWEKLRWHTSRLWEDRDLLEAGKRCSSLVKAQRQAIAASRTPTTDFAEKALNYAVVSAWAFVAGMLSTNPVRLIRHFDLDKRTKTDPLNAAALAGGRHKTDPDNYRGLGYRTDAKERGRLVELFAYQAERGDGITKKNIEVAIARYHSKQAYIEKMKIERARG